MQLLKNDGPYLLSGLHTHLIAGTATLNMIGLGALEILFGVWGRGLINLGESEVAQICAQPEEKEEATG